MSNITRHDSCHSAPWYNWLPRSTSAAIVLLGLSVLLGWSLDSEALKRIGSGFVGMNPATAVCLVLGGVALWVIDSRSPGPWHKPLILIASLVLAMVGITRLAAYAHGWDRGLDTILFQSSLNVSSIEGRNRMAPNTAALFIGVSAAMLVMHYGGTRLRRVADGLSVGVFLLALLAAVGYAYNVKPMYSVAAFIPMALHTALGLLALSLGLLFVRPLEGLLAVVLSPRIGGVVARRFLPAAVLITLAISWLRLQGQLAGLYDTELGVAMMAVATVTLLAVFTYWNAALLNRADELRNASERALKTAHDGLDDLVRQRTDELKKTNQALRAEMADRTLAQQLLSHKAAQLQQTNRELEQFAYVASHDLQEPLRMVTSYLQLLERRLGDRLEPDLREFIGFAVDGGNRMKQLINDLLQFSRLERRGQTIVATDFTAALQDALVNLRAAIEESGAVITTENLPASEGESATPPVYADPSQLRQLLQNLIGNAIKFRAEPPTIPQIRIWARRDNAAWTFSVQDNGIGIDPQCRQRIFEVFQRLHSREQYPGTGIGLAICKKIVERHGGKIWVDAPASSQPANGSVFNFTLPDQEVAHQRAAA